MRGVSWMLLVSLALAAAGCGSDAMLVVRVRTDFVAVREVTEVRVRLLDEAGSTLRTVTHDVESSSDLLDGTTVAELDALAGPVANLAVTLRGESGTLVERRLVVTVRGATQIVTVVLTRDCFGISCEEATGACLNARCVDPACTDENPDACGEARCDAAADCGASGTECSAVECRDGSCLEVPDGSQCTAPETCTPERGCVSPDDTCPVLEVVAHTESRITSDETWPAAEHVLESGLEIDASLRVAACSIVRVPLGARISVGAGGSLRLEGAPGRPVTVTGAAAVAAPGAWSRIAIDGRGVESVFEHAVIDAAGSDGPAIRVCPGCSIAMTASRVQRSRGVGLSIEEGALVSRFESNSFTDNGDVGLEVDATVVGTLGVGTYGPNAREGILVRGSPVGRDTTLRSLGAPYVVNGLFRMATTTGTARLTIEAGTTLLMESGSAIVASTNAAIGLHGTAAAPVNVRSARPVPSPGDWLGFELEGGSIGAENRFEHAVVEDGGGPSRAMVLVRPGTSWRASDSSFRRSAGLGVEVHGDLDDLTDCTLMDNVGGAISVQAAHVGNIHGGVFAPNDLEGIFFYDHLVEADATWENHGVPYVLGSVLTVRGPSPGGSALLTISAGTEIRVGSDSRIDVGERGALALEGTSAAPVLVTTPNPVGAPEDWDSIWLLPGSVGPQNVFRHAIIEYGNAAGYGVLRLSSGSHVTLEDVVFRFNGDACDIAADSVVGVTATRSPYVTCP